MHLSNLAICWCTRGQRLNQQKASWRKTSKMLQKKSTNNWKNCADKTYTTKKHCMFNENGIVYRSKWNTKRNLHWYSMLQKPILYMYSFCFTCLLIQSKILLFRASFYFFILLFSFSISISSCPKCFHQALNTLSEFHIGPENNIDRKLWKWKF